jgi:hypothetical protein
MADPAPREAVSLASWSGLCGTNVNQGTIWAVLGKTGDYRLWRVEVLNECVVQELTLWLGDGSGVSIAIPNGTAAILGKAELAPAGLWLAQIVGMGGGPGNLLPYCEWTYPPDFVIGPDGTLDPIVC